jgi:hypothetical protein
MVMAMNLQVDAQSPIPIRRQLTELAGARQRGRQRLANPGPAEPRELVGFLGITGACAPSKISSGVGTGRFSSDGGGALVRPEGAPGPRPPRRRPCVVTRASVNVPERPRGVITKKCPFAARHGSGRPSVHIGNPS